MPVVARTSSRLAGVLAEGQRARAAARKASRRMSIGVEPACACAPVKRTAWRSTPNVPSTTPSGMSIARAPAPARCAARGRRRAPSSAARASSAGRARRRARQRVGRLDAVAVGQAADRVGSSVPAAALEPSRLRPKRAPSSSAQSTSLSVSGRGSRRCARSTSRPASTLSAAVEPAAVGHRVQMPADDHEALGVAGAVAQLLPAASVSTADAVDPVQLGAQPIARRHPRVRPGHALRAVVVAVSRPAPAGPRRRGRRRSPPCRKPNASRSDGPLTILPGSP